MPIDRVNRRTAVRMLQESTERIAGHRSVLVFPEETYSREPGLLPFQRGGFVLALKTGLPILPVGIAGTRDALPPGRHLIAPGTLRIRFGDPIPTVGLGVSSRQTLSDRTREMIEELAGA
jgi:1-acyl-sn-glycerol-3-phosphate acyltransferase